MSIRRTADLKTEKKVFGPISAGGGGGEATAWTRPADWLTLTDPAAGEQKFVGLHAVWPGDGNFVAINFSGNYTVDWGDGSAPENINSATTAYHEYSYSSISSSTESTRGYRQVIVTVTPQSGANLTSFNLFLKHNQSGLGIGYATGWLDISARLPNLTSLQIGAANTTVRHNLIEQVKLLDNGSVTSFANLFYNLQALQSVQLDDTSAVTNMSGMFINCYSLQTVPLFDTSAATNMTSMLYYCSSLKTVPLFDTSAVTNMSSMFSSCYSLETVPLFDTSAVTNMSNMFFNCYSLKTVPLFDTSAATYMTSMLYNCSSLKTVPLFDTSAVTNMFNMFNRCYSLQTVPLFDTSAVTNFASMFSECYALSYIPASNVSSASSSTSYSGMFASTPSLAYIGMTGHKYTFSVQNCKLSSDALDTLYTNLATVVGQTITVTGNYGTAADDPTIATAKGWTVTG